MGIWKIIAATVFLIAAATGLGLYVFPERPWIGWALLFFCWACYRLKMRAERLFRPRQVDPAQPFPESGSKGGEVRRNATDTTLSRYYEWLDSSPPAEPQVGRRPLP